MTKRKPKAAIPYQAPDPLAALADVDLTTVMTTMGWLTDDWLEADALLGSLGFQTQRPDGTLYPMADRIRDMLGPYYERVKPAAQTENGGEDARRF